MKSSPRANFFVDMVRSRTGRRIFALPLHVRRRWLAAQNAGADRLLGDLSIMLRGEVTMRVDQFDADFIMDPRSHLFHRVARDHVYEPELWQLFLKYVDPARDVVDVGANIGFFSVGVGLKLGNGRVLSAEPMPEVYSRLSRNIEKNGLSQKAILFNGAVSDRSGTLEIQSISGLEEYSSLGSIRHPAALGKDVTKSAVPTARLDDLVAHHNLKPGLIKIDVEGAESLVFAGAQAVLKEFKPVILSELSDALLKPMGSSVREVVSELRSFGYRVIDPLNPSIEPGSQEFGEILCLPN